MHPTAEDFKDAVGAFTTGVTLVTVRDGRDDIGATVNAFCSLSLDPPMVGVAIGGASYLAEVLDRRADFAVTVLAAGQKALAGRFAAAGRPSARLLLANVPHHRGPRSEALTVEGGCAALDCAVTTRLSTGDHVFFAAAVTAVGYTHPAAAPLLHTHGSYG